jgi:carboxymethylenebutenolidase
MSLPAAVKPSPAGVPGAVTEPSRIHAEDLRYPGAGGDLVNAYLALPSFLPADEPRPGVIVIHEAGGLGEHIRDVVNRFANLGYNALGPDLYTREGGPPPMDNLTTLMERLFAMSDATVLADLEAAAELLLAREDSSGKLACLGFCMGGRYTLLFACSSPRLSAAVDCWGGFIDTATLEDRSTPTRPTPPLELAEQLRCPLMAAVSADDHNPSPALGEELRERAAKSGQEVTVDVYEDAGHAFFADYRPSYRPAPAALLWERAVPFLHNHLH